ncbi:hypothetical protein MES5069_310034 [Mesorhizobium escarrei]|uniref:Uncharacterized protein n=1 Tax=Mesorhizobium escarrei TaxID=666018 RepID=A0ABN8JYM6_9HYPH|nr:hypothetical protein MES5069_310034 [Mesorhizobium escarrei]
MRRESLTSFYPLPHCTTRFQCVAILERRVNCARKNHGLMPLSIEPGAGSARLTLINHNVRSFALGILRSEFWNVLPASPWSRHTKSSHSRPPTSYNHFPGYTATPSGFESTLRAHLMQCSAGRPIFTR